MAAGYDVIKKPADMLNVAALEIYRCALCRGVPRRAVLCSTVPRCAERGVVLQPRMSALCPAELSCAGVC